jgi:hypothetical protein
MPPALRRPSALAQCADPGGGGDGPSSSGVAVLGLDAVPTPQVLQVGKIDARPVYEHYCGYAEEQRDAGASAPGRRDAGDDATDSEDWAELLLATIEQDAPAGERVTRWLIAQRQEARPTMDDRSAR